MNDEQKCALIAKFEGIELERGPLPTPWYHPHYFEDLNCTMRAARRLPNEMKQHLGFVIGLALIHGDDPARAAMECLYEWISSQRKP